ncbi:MAG TPA: rhodanese-like domain-containing protein [Bacteroidales bacterium]|nr:rhodanese-like domain-containing protein [Bacteroidales bacterium]
MRKFFESKGIVSGGILNLSPAETLEICKKGGIIVDVREDYLNRYKMFDVEEIIFCPQSILAKNLHELPSDKPLIIADSTGINSKKAMLLLKEKGFKNIANMAGGMVEWERDGLPIKEDKTERLTGSCACMLRRRDK